MEEIPKTMRSLVAPRACKPDEYEIRRVPVPTISHPDEVLLRIHAAGMNTFDPLIASGRLSMLLKSSYGFQPSSPPLSSLDTLWRPCKKGFSLLGPLTYQARYPEKIGAEGAGVVVAVGAAVKDLKVGDEVYGLYIDKPLSTYAAPGFVSDYALCQERFLLRKPAHMSFEEAAALSGFVVTALQSIRRGLQLGGLDGLQGKTVFVPGALSGTGSIMLQVARTVFGAERIVSTVSTAKLGLVDDYLPPGSVDQVVDYTAGDVGQAVGRGIVDFAISTQHTSLNDSIAVLNPRSGVLISITEGFGKETIREMIGAVKFFWLLGLVLDLMQLYYRRWKLGGTNVLFDAVSGSVNIREDLERAGEVIASGKVRAVMRVVKLDDLEAVKRNCEQLRTGKGGIGKLVIEIV